MSDTLGGLVDKLATTVVKLFMVQDVVNEASRAGEGLDAGTVQKLTALNSQRNALMTEIDQTLADAAQGKVRVEQRIKLG